MARDLFISYSSVNKEIAQAMCSTLESKSIRCWIAPRNIPPGKDYPEALVEAIKECPIFVLILSSRSGSSDDVKNEVANAARFKRTIITFRIENVEPSDALMYHLMRPQWYDATLPPLERHLQALAINVKQALDALKTKSSSSGPEDKNPSEDIWQNTNTGAWKPKTDPAEFPQQKPVTAAEQETFRKGKSALSAPLTFLAGVAAFLLFSVIVLAGIFFLFRFFLHESPSKKELGFFATQMYPAMSMRLTSASPVEIKGLETEPPDWQKNICSIIYESSSGLYRGWYVNRFYNGRCHSIWSATSRDGINWQNTREVVFKERSYTDSYAGCAAPLVLFAGGKYRMWMNEYHIGHPWKGWIVYFESADGIEWDGFCPVLKPTEREWEDFQVFPSSLIIKDNNYLLYYLGAEEKTKRIQTGVAMSEDGLIYNKRTRAPVIPAGCQVICTEGTSPFIELHSMDKRIVYSRSSDGLNWNEPVPLLENSTFVHIFHDPRTRSTMLYYRNIEDGRKLLCRKLD